MSEKYRKWLVQFVYLIYTLDFRASKDYRGIKVHLPSRSFGTATLNIWTQLKVPGHPGNGKLIKPKSSDNTTAKLEIIFWVKYLPTLRRHDEIWRLLDWNCRNWWRNYRKIKFSNLPKFYYQPIGQKVWHAGCALFFYWWHEKTALCHFRVIWLDWRNRLFIHSPTVNNLLSSFIFSLTLKNFEISSLLAFLDLRKYSKSNFDLSAKSLSSRKFQVNFWLSDLTAKRSSAKIFQVNFWLSRKTSIILKKLSFLNSSRRSNDPKANIAICRRSPTGR